MQYTDLKPLREIYKSHGIKCIAYGKPGSGKTPLIATAPRPVMLILEKGLMSIRHSSILGYEADTVEKIEDFIKWVTTSNEAKNFDTLAVDSLSELAEIYLKVELGGKSKSGNKVDGKAAYGAMAMKVKEQFDKLYYLREKHLYAIAKEQLIEINGVNHMRPYFPGKDLNIKFGHQYDQIFWTGKENVGGVEHNVLRTQATYNIFARDRSGMLAELEPHNLAAIFQKAMQ